MYDSKFKKRRKIAALTCVVTLVLLVLNSRCSNSVPDTEHQSVTQKSGCAADCDTSETVEVEVGWHRSGTTEKDV